MKEPEKETVAQSMVDIVDVVSDYQNKENAIGYSYYYYITTMYWKVVKPSYEVKEGDIVEIKFGDKVSKFQILKVPKVAGKDMGELIKIL